LKIRYSDELESYKGFFDHDWIQQLTILTDGSQLERPVFELGASWKGNSNARRLPWLMMVSLKESVEGFANYYEPTPMRVISTLVERISNRLERKGITLISSDRQALISEFKEIEDHLSQKLRQNPLTVNSQGLWLQFVNQPEFVLSLWMSEVNAYSSIYFACENFLISVVKTLGNLTSLRPRQLESRLTNLIGSRLAQICWTDESVEKARLIRHAVVHNGRKITSDLERYRNQLFLEDDEIVIMPVHTNQLYDDLKDRVTQFCQAVIHGS